MDSHPNTAQTERKEIYPSYSLIEHLIMQSKSTNPFYFFEGMDTQFDEEVMN